MADDKQKSKDDIIRELTAANAGKPFEEFPKWVYHPDGRSQIVKDEAEQSKLGGEWLARPQEALDARESRDKRDSDKFIAKVGAEAAETSGKPKR